MHRRQLADRMDRIDTSRIRKMFDLASGLENPINLSIGQPHFPTPEPIIKALKDALQKGKTSYTTTQGILPLRERVAQKFQESNGFISSPENIIISSGVASLIQLLLMALIEPDDRALLLDPYFLIHKSMLDFFQAKIETLPETFTAEDIERIKPEGLKMIMYCSPSNPSGNILSEKQIKLLANLADISGACLVADEIYELFDYDKQFVSAGAVYPDAVTLMGFSKSYSMTGLRLAAAAGPQDIIKALVTLQQYTIVCAPAPVQWAGIEALDIDMTPFIDIYHKNRDYCLEILSSRLQFIRPAGAFYCFPQILENDNNFVERAIHEKKLLVVPGNIFTSSHNYIRISYATDFETLKMGLQALLELI